MDEFEAKLRRAFSDIAGLKTPKCLDVSTIGLYAEEKLPDEEKAQAEAHIKSCLYCLNQLTEMKELLYFRSQKAQVSPELVNKLKALHARQETGKVLKTNIGSFFHKIGQFFTSPFWQWRYAAVSLVSVCVTVLISVALLKPGKPAIVTPGVNLNSFVNVRALGNNGEILSEAQGVIVSSHGLVASDLYSLAGARSVQVALRDGTTYITRNIWKDEDKNLAVMKIDNETAPSIPLANIKEINVGEHAFVFVDPAHPKKGFKEALVSDFKTYPGRRRGEQLQYIQLASLTTTLTRGAIVDKDGKLIGFLLTSEKNINLAVPFQDVEKMVKEHKAIPVNELRNVKFSTEALKLYMQGILSRDAQRWDQAIDFFKRAVELNPNLEGAHLELGYLYYRKRLYELEAREYLEALRINPENTDAIFSLATNLETRGFYKQAIERYEKVISLDPEDAETYYNLGLAYIADGQTNRAMELYAKLKALDAGSAEMLKRLAR